MIPIMKTKRRTSGMLGMAFAFALAGGRHVHSP